MHRSTGLLCCVLLAVLPQTSEAQTPAPAAVPWEIAIDDQGFSGQFGVGWLSLDHLGALDVHVADFDGDSVQDILIGGGGQLEPEVPAAEAYVVRIHYLDHTAGTLTVRETETLDIGSTRSLYDMAVGDVDGNGWPDIVVGRRLQSASEVQAGARDALFLNLGPDGAGGAQFSGAIDLENPLAACHDLGECGQTFSVALADFDADGRLDLLSCGDFGIRHYRNVHTVAHATVQDCIDAAATGGCTVLELTASYAEAGLPQNHRSLDVADIDNDTDLDFIVARQEGLPTRVYYNQRIDPDLGVGAFGLCGGPSPYTREDPFWADHRQPSLVALPAERDAVQWTLMDAGQPVDSGSLGGFGSAFAAELQDVDGDGWVDAVITFVDASGAVYLNDGSGYLGAPGCGDGPDCMGLSSPGVIACPDYVFPDITPDWTGTSAGLTGFHVAVGQIAAPTAGQHYEFSMAGTLVNHSSDVDMADVNGDGRPDVLFSNRNDRQDDIFLFGNGELGTLPDCYDHLFYNASVPGQVRFLPWVELIGLPNDGTGYGTFAQLDAELVPGWEGSDHRPDWLDANFANRTDVDGGRNGVFAGHGLVLRGAPRVVIEAIDERSLRIPLHLETTGGTLGDSWQIVGSLVGVEPGAYQPQAGGPAAAVIPDALTTWMDGHPDFQGTFGGTHPQAVTTTLRIPGDKLCGPGGAPPVLYLGLAQLTNGTWQWASNHGLVVPVPEEICQTLGQ